MHPSPRPVREVVEAWLLWAAWQSDTANDGKENPELIGFIEFDELVREHPEHAWQCILATVADDRAQQLLGLLAAGPIEDLLSIHGATFIDRVEEEARQNSRFAWALGGVWRLQMTDEIWTRVQQVWDLRGWGGIPA